MEIAQCVGIGFEMADKGGLSGADTILIAFPSFENWLAKSATESERERPRIGSVLTNGGEVFGGSFGFLPTAKQEYTSKKTRNSVAKDGRGSHSDLLGSVVGIGLAAGGDHISFENTTG